MQSLTGVIAVIEPTTVIDMTDVKPSEIMRQGTWEISLVNP